MKSPQQKRQKGRALRKKTGLRLTWPDMMSSRYSFWDSCTCPMTSRASTCWARGVIHQGLGPSCIWQWVYLSGPQGLLATNLLPRLRYVLEVTCPGPSVVLDILAVLVRLARHSLESATRVRKKRERAESLAGPGPGPPPPYLPFFLPPHRS